MGAPTHDGYSNQSGKHRVNWIINRFLVISRHTLIRKFRADITSVTRIKYTTWLLRHPFCNNLSSPEWQGRGGGGSLRLIGTGPDLSTALEQLGGRWRGVQPTVLVHVGRHDEGQ